LSIVALAFGSAGCEVQPLTPTPTHLAQAALVVMTFMPSPTPTRATAETAFVARPGPGRAREATATLEAFPKPTEAGAVSLSAQAVVTSIPPTAAPPPAATPVPPIRVAPPPAADAACAAPCEVAAAEQYTIDLINARRAAAGVPPLARDETLMGIARARVADMVARGYTGHNDPLTGERLARSLMRAAGYTSSYLGENWYGSISGPPALVEIAMGWFMTDPPHANNILSPHYVVVGVGIAFNGRQWLLVQNFAGTN
jgi:uncharacterized protein YkwD